MLTLLELSDVNGKPKVKLDLPGPLNVGHRVRLSFCLRRQHAGRSEVLEISGEFRVSAVGLDFAGIEKRQVLSMESTAVTTPHWRSVKKQPEMKRVLSPAKAARREIE